MAALSYSAGSDGLGKDPGMDTDLSVTLYLDLDHASVHCLRLLDENLKQKQSASGRLLRTSI